MNDTKTIKKSIKTGNKIDKKKLQNNFQGQKESENWKMNINEFKKNGCLVNAGD